MKYINFDDSFLEVINPKNNLKSGGVLYKVPASTEDGFSFEYLLFIPSGIKDHTKLVFEGMNYVLDNKFDLNDDVDILYDEFKSFRDNIHYVNSKTNYPIVYPLIPRYYINVFSSKIFDVKNEYERIDKQIVNMIKDAKRRLYDNDIVIDDKLILYGFSSSGIFVNRFALLHPDIVKLVIAGGVSGTLILPFKKYKNNSLMYPVGIGNIDEISDYKVEMFLKIKQFYFQDINDKVDYYASKDGIPIYNDISNGELKMLYEVLGRKIETRWKNIRMIYRKVCKNIIFRTYNYGIHSDVTARELSKKLFEREEV